MKSLHPFCHLKRRSIQICRTVLTYYKKGLLKISANRKEQKKNRQQKICPNVSDKESKFHTHVGTRDVLVQFLCVCFFFMPSSIFKCDKTISFLFRFFIHFHLVLNASIRFKLKFFIVILQLLYLEVRILRVSHILTNK